MAVTDPYVDKVLADIESAKRRFVSRRWKMMQIRAIREGNFNEVAPGLFPPDLPEPMIANFIDVAARAAAEAVAPLPSFTCANPNMSTEAARKSADKRTKIANNYVQHSRLGEHNVLAADHIDSYGFTAYVVEPDFVSKTPCIYVEDAIDAYYALNRKGETVWFARCFRRMVDELKWEYYDYYDQLQALKDNGQQDVEVIRYYGPREDLLLVPAIKAVLIRLENPLEKCRVRVVERPRTGMVPRGAYDDLVWVQLARVMMAQYTLRIAEQVANAPTAVPDDVQDLEIGPESIIRTQNPQAVKRVDLSVPQHPFVELQQLGEELRIGSRHPEGRDGNMDASIITGKGVQALMAGYDARIKTLQGRLANALTDVIAMCFELDEKLWPTLDKSVRGLEDGAPFELRYRPAKDIAGDYSCNVSYGLTAGLDPNRALVFLLQGLTSGVFSRDTVQRQMPFDLDVVAEQKRIYVEQIRDALLGSIAALPQAIPAMAMQGGDPTEVVRKTSDVIAALQKGTSIEEAVSKAFPAPPPPQAPEEAAAGGAPGGAPPGFPGVGPVGQPGAAGPAPGPAEQLLQAIAGTGGSGNPNLSLQAVTRRPT